jgi:hypothetical protein
LKIFKGSFMQILNSTSKDILHNASYGAVAGALVSPIGALGGAIFGALDKIISDIAKRYLGNESFLGSNPTLKTVISLALTAVTMNLLGYSLPIVSVAGLAITILGIKKLSAQGLQAVHA